MQDGYTSGGGLGLGLPGARRLVDEFDIETAPGQGTTVTLVKWSRARERMTDGWPAELEVGVAGLAHPGRGPLGRPGGVRAATTAAGWSAVIDGLGHGDDAADAAGGRARDPRSARRRLAGGAARALPRRRCAEPRRRADRAWFDLEGAPWSWAGVGNVEARLCAGRRPRRPPRLRARARRRRRLQPPAGAARRTIPRRATRSRSPPTGSRPTTRLADPGCPRSPWRSGS